MPQLSTFNFQLSTHCPGARLYHSTASVWLSVDPLSDNTPGVTPYAYCVNNPIRIIDPDGRDWFENEKTGDVYYSRDYHQGDEHLIDGEGWKWMGENGMFGKSDHSVISDHLQQADVFAGDDEISRAAFSGNNATHFMGDMGYKSVPTQVVHYENTYEQSVPATPIRNMTISYGFSIDYVEKVGYVPSDFYENGRKTLNSIYGNFEPMSNNTPSVSRQTVFYGKQQTRHNWISSLYQAMHGKHNYVESQQISFSRYQGNNILINRFLNRYPK